MKKLNDMNFKETIKDIPNRVLTLIWKLFSVKVLILIASFWLVFTGKLEGWFAVVLLLVMALIVIFGRESIKFIEALKGLK
jgi:hypothetical protein